MTTAFDTAQERFEALGSRERTLIMCAITSLKSKPQAPTTEEMRDAFYELGSLAEIAQGCYAASLLGKFVLK
jgi:hypothetical protein